VGTFKLVKVVEALREKIIALGGTILFQHKVVELLMVLLALGRQRKHRTAASDSKCTSTSTS
jgi:uncharacterized FAD-dependent dehydrogenase